MKWDINLDAGEDPDSLESGREARLYRWVTRINVACGGHAGDRHTMTRAVRLARDARILVGAHPSFPDREHFGRRVLPLPMDEIARFVAEQVRSLAAVCRSESVALVHVKPHGALYNACAGDPALAGAVARGVKAVAPGVALVGLAGSRCLDVWRSAGFRVLAEAFADRAYRADGTLVPRSQPGAVHTDPGKAAEQVRALFTEGRVRALTGEMLPMACDTVCVHGDNPGAEVVLKAIHGL